MLEDATLRDAGEEPNLRYKRCPATNVGFVSRGASHFRTLADSADDAIDVAWRTLTAGRLTGRKLYGRWLAEECCKVERRTRTRIIKHIQLEREEFVDGFGAVELFEKELDPGPMVC